MKQKLLDTAFRVFCDLNFGLVEAKERLALAKGKILLRDISDSEEKKMVGCFYYALLFALFTKMRESNSVKEILKPYFSFLAKYPVTAEERIRVLRESFGLLLLAIREDDLGVLDLFLDSLESDIPSARFYKWVIEYMREYWRPEKNWEVKVKNLRKLQDRIMEPEKEVILEHISFVILANGLQEIP